MRNLLMAGIVLLALAGCVERPEQGSVFDNLDSVFAAVGPAGPEVKLFLDGVWYKDATPIFCDGIIVEDVCYTETDGAIEE